MPVAVEALGLWTPFGRATIREIATKGAVFSGADRGTANTQPAAAIILKLWLYNGKMLLSTPPNCPD